MRSIQIMRYLAKKEKKIIIIIMRMSFIMVLV